MLTKSRTRSSRKSTTTEKRTRTRTALNHLLTLAGCNNGTFIRAAIEKLHEKYLSAIATSVRRYEHLDESVRVGILRAALSDSGCDAYNTAVSKLCCRADIYEFTQVVWYFKGQLFDEKTSALGDDLFETLKTRLKRTNDRKIICDIVEKKQLVIRVALSTPSPEVLNKIVPQLHCIDSEEFVTYTKALRQTEHEAWLPDWVSGQYDFLVRDSGKSEKYALLAQLWPHGKSAALNLVGNGSCIQKQCLCNLLAQVRGDGQKAAIEIIAAVLKRECDNALIFFGAPPLTDDSAPMTDYAAQGTSVLYQLKHIANAVEIAAMFPDDIPHGLICPPNYPTIEARIAIATEIVPILVQTLARLTASRNVKNEQELIEALTTALAAVICAWDPIVQLKSAYNWLSYKYILKLLHLVTSTLRSRVKPTTPFDDERDESEKARKDVSIAESDFSEKQLTEIAHCKE